LEVVKMKMNMAMLRRIRRVMRMPVMILSGLRLVSFSSGSSWG
jgi:hypothetical protein